MLKVFKAVIVAAGLAAATLASAQVTTNVYRGFTSGGDGTPFSDLAGTLDTAGVTFATDTAYAWHPFGLSSFGSQSSGNLSVAVAGSYLLGLNSDDGSSLYIDGGLVIDNGGAHGPTLRTSLVTLTAGLHSFQVNFWEDFGGASGVDLNLAPGVEIAASVPEPETYALMLGGLLVLGAVARRRS